MLSKYTAEQLIAVVAKAKEIKAFLSVKERWTKGWFAKNSEGRYVGSVSKHAVCWCLLGAINKFTNTFVGSDLVGLFIDYLFHHGYGTTIDKTDIGEFNDTHSYEEVMHVWNEFIHDIESHLVLHAI